MSDKKQIFTLSTGVQFSVHEQLSPLLLIDAMDSVPDPKPPQVEVTGMGGRKAWRENPDDPDYIARKNDADLKRNMLVARIIMKMSLKLESPLPESDDWLATPSREMAGYVDEILDSPGGKEYLYLRYVAVKTTDDMNLIVRAGNLTEEGVAAAAERFQGNEEPSTHPLLPTPEAA